MSSVQSRARRRTAYAGRSHAWSLSLGWTRTFAHHALDNVMPRTSASRRTLRAFLGLPHSRGFYNRHPEFVEKGQRNTILGHVKRDAQGVSRIVPDEPFAECDDIDLEHGDVHLDILDEYSRKGIDSGLSAVEEEAWRKTNCAEGDENELSVSLAEDVWHLLTVDLSIARLLALEVMLELANIVFFAVIMFAVDILEGSATGDEAVPARLFRSKLLLSLTAVRLSTDSIFGWTGRRASSGAEVAVLAFQGWFHWLLLSIAGAVIVARALKPLRQVVFSPDCCLTNDELSLRMQIIRHKSMTLYNMAFQLQLVARGGQTWNLPLPHGVDTIARWTSAMPLTIRHVIDENSPLARDKGLRDTILSLRISMTAVDSNGGPVYAGMVYYAPRGFFGKQPGFRKEFLSKGYVFPRILVDKRFVDQIRAFRDQTKPDAPMEKATTLPLLAVDLDSMSRTLPTDGTTTFSESRTEKADAEK